MTQNSTKGALTRCDYPGGVVGVACDSCDRRGQYRRSTLITLFGAKATLPDVLAELACCPRTSDASAPCGAY